MEIYQIKIEREKKQSQLFTATGLFWAFSNEQFEKNKTPLEPGDKYVRLPHGGFLPKSNLDTMLTGMEEINKWFKAEINANKETRRAHIAYELNNHEAFYTGCIDSTCAALGDDYTPAEVRKVYNQEQGINFDPRHPEINQL